MKPHYSLAEAFQRGLLKTDPPKADETVGYYIHIYPEIDTEELIRRAALENIQAEDGSFNYGDPRVAGATYVWCASLDYCNEATNEIVHRAELVRATKEKLYQAMREYAEVITDPRQRKVCLRALAQQTQQKP